MMHEQQKSTGAFHIPADFGTLHVKVVEGADLFVAMDHGLYEKKSVESICLDVSTFYGTHVHSSFSTSAVSYIEGSIEFDNESYVFESVKPEHFLQITLIALRNYTTGYGISPQSLGVLKIPVERLHENTISQWYPFYAPSGISTLRCAVKLEITYHRDKIYFRGIEDAPEVESLDICRTEDAESLQKNADGASSPEKTLVRRRSFANFGRGPSMSASMRQLSSQDMLGADKAGANEKYDRMPVGLADYFVVVGPTAASINPDDVNMDVGNLSLTEKGDVSIWDRFPRNDYPDGPMPPKVEWFCFPDGAIYHWCKSRPSPRLSSFIMLAGDSRQYGVTLVYFVRAEMSHGAPPPTEPTTEETPGSSDKGTEWWNGQLEEEVYVEGASSRSSFDEKTVCWMGVCICFLTRAPFVQQLSVCLMKLYLIDILPKLHTWESGFLMDKKAQLRMFKYSPFYIESSFLLVSLCLDCPLPVPDVFYVNMKLPEKYDSPLIREMLDSYFPGVFAGQTVGPDLTAETSSNLLFSSIPPSTQCGDLVFNLPSHRTLYKCQYSLEEFFLLFGVRGGVDLVHCAILEQKILFHSRDFSLLPMACECVRALLYPLSCSCVYIPVVPSTLLDLVEAPVPYILGIHSAWLDLFKPELLADVLICDCNTGNISVGMEGPALKALGIPKLPEKLDRWLVMGLKYALGYLDTNVLFCLEERAEVFDEISSSKVLHDKDIQSIIQLLFIDALSSFFIGLPECLIFIDSEYPVFNKTLFLSEFTKEEDCEFVRLLIETQGFDRLISTIQTPNLTFFCMGMERRVKRSDIWKCSECDSLNEQHRKALNIQARQFPEWVYSRVSCSMLLNISHRCAGEFANIKILVDTRLSIYGYGGDGVILESEVNLLHSNIYSIFSKDIGAVGEKSASKRHLDVLVSNDATLDSKRSRLLNGHSRFNKVTNRKSVFFDGFFGGKEGTVLAAKNYDIAKTIEKNLTIKKSRRGGLIGPTSFDANDGLGSGSFGHSGSFAENDKFWAMETNRDAASISRGPGQNSFRESFVGSEFVVDPPVRFSKATFQAALKNAGNWSVFDVATSLNLPQDDIVNAVERKSTGKGNITLRGSFVEGGVKQRDAVQLLALTDTNPNLPSTPEGKAILELIKSIHSGNASPSFSHTTSMKLLQDSIYALNFKANRRRLLQILSNSERGTYGLNDDDTEGVASEKTKFIQVDFEAFEVLVTICSQFLTSCMTNKDYSSAFSLLEKVKYYFRLAAVIGKRNKEKLGQTYLSFTRRSIFQNCALNMHQRGSDDDIESSDTSLSPEMFGDIDDENCVEVDDVTGQKFTALRLAAYELAESKTAILKDCKSSSFRNDSFIADNDTGIEKLARNQKKSVSFVPLAPLRAAEISQRESILSQLCGHPIFQVLEFWQDVLDSRMSKQQLESGKNYFLNEDIHQDLDKIVGDGSAGNRADVCATLLQDINSFAMPGDLGVVCLQATALRWSLTVQEYKMLFNKICRLWDLEAQLHNIDKAFELWNLNRQKSYLDIVSEGKRSTVDTEKNCSVVELAESSDSLFFPLRPLTRRHTVHDIFYTEGFSTTSTAQRNFLLTERFESWATVSSAVERSDVVVAARVPHRQAGVIRKKPRRHSESGLMIINKLKSNFRVNHNHANASQSRQNAAGTSIVSFQEQTSTEYNINNGGDKDIQDKLSDFSSGSFESDPESEDVAFNISHASSGNLMKSIDIVDHNKNNLFEPVAAGILSKCPDFEEAQPTKLECVPSGNNSFEEARDFFPNACDILSLSLGETADPRLIIDTKIPELDGNILKGDPSPLVLSGQNSTVATMSLGLMNAEGENDAPIIRSDPETNHHKRSNSVPMKITAVYPRLSFVNVPIESSDLHMSDITSLSAFDRWLVCGDSSGAVRVIDMKTARLIECREHSESIKCVVCLPRGEGYISCCRGGVISLWSYPRSPEISTTKGQDDVGRLSNKTEISLRNDLYNPSAKRTSTPVGSYSEFPDEPSLSRWGMITGLKKTKIATVKLGPVRVTAFTTNVGDLTKLGMLSGPLLCAVGGSKGELRVFCKQQSGFIEIFHHNQYDPSGNSSKNVCCLFLATNEKRISVRKSRLDNSSTEGSSTTRSGMLARMRSTRSSSNMNNTEPVVADGYLAVGSRSGVVECWDVAKQECIFSTTLGHADGHVGRVNALTLLMNSSSRLPPLLLSGGNDRTARLYDIRSKRCALVIDSASGPVTSVAGGSGDLSTCLLFIGSADGVIRSYSFRNGEAVRLIRIYRGHSDRVVSIETFVESNETMLRTFSRDGTVRLWNTGLPHDEDDDTSGVIEKRHIPALNYPLEASTILRPPKVPFLAINAAVSSICRSPSSCATYEAVPKNSFGLKAETPCSVSRLSANQIDAKEYFVAAGMSDGSLCLWKATSTT